MLIRSQALCALVLMLFGVTSLDAQDVPVKEPKPKAIDDDALKVDPASLSKLKLWHAPFSKGEFLSGYNLRIADEAGDTDFFWNLRDSEAWPGNDLWQVRSATEMPLMRRTYEAWPSMHQQPKRRRPIEWKLLHSPHQLGIRSAHLRFRRSSTRKDKEYIHSFFSELWADFGVEGRQLLTLPNLSDSPRIGEKYALFRVFKSSRNQANLAIYPIDRSKRIELPKQPVEKKEEKKAEGKEGDKKPVEKEEKPEEPEFTVIQSNDPLDWKLGAPFEYAPKDFPYVSRPSWVNANTFVCLRASKLQTLGGVKDSAYFGDLVLVTIGEKNALSTRVLAKDVTMPTDSITTPIAVYANDYLGTNIALLDQDGEKRRIRTFAFPEKADLRVSEFKEEESPWIHGLSGLRLEYQIEQKAFRVGCLLGSRLAWCSNGAFEYQNANSHLKSACSMYVRGRYNSTYFIKMPENGGLPKGASPIIAHPASTIAMSSEKFKSHLKARSYAKHSPAAMRFDELFSLRNPRVLSNMVLAYKSEIKIDAKEIKNKQGQMLEFWKPRSGRKSEALRYEDSLDGTWQIRSMARAKGEWKLYQASDAAPNLVPSRLKKDRMLQQLKVRKLLVMNGLASDSKNGMRFVMTREVLGLRDAKGERAKVKAHAFLRTLEDGSFALYYFPAAGKTRDPIIIEVNFQLGDRRSRVRLLLSEYTTVPDLSGNGKGLLVPSKIEGIGLESKKSEFVLSLLKGVTRKTFKGGRGEIRSGYNWLPLDDADFNKNYAFEK